MKEARVKKTYDSQKEARLKRFIDGLYRGRWDTLRPGGSSDRALTPTRILDTVRARIESLANRSLPRL